MDLSNRHAIREVFVIKTEKIDFFGAMMKEREGKSNVNGKVSFRDGSRWFFQSQEGDYASLKRQLVSLCENIAEFYHTDIFHLKFTGAMGHEEFIRRMREAKHRMRYA